MERVRQAIGTIINPRRAATAVVIAAGCSFGWHAVWGHNGISAYAAKRVEDKKLAQEIGRLSDENARLQSHVAHLQSDPDAIEVTARQRLHYTRPGEVIYALPDTARASK